MSTEAVAPSFYVTGGTLRHDAPSYVVRRADTDLYEGLSRGEFCYILTSRQMGKSSLMARAAARLRRDGVAVAVLDLTAVGQNLNPEQWYDGLRDLLGQQLDLEDELDDFWSEQSHLGPLQRWMKALREVVIARIPGRIVIFLEEIDTVQSLPFSTDEFFAGIRECYTRRTRDPEFDRLTFCLLGVASPSDLIRDTRLTPFNIGRRIELTDFTEAEAAPLAAGLVGTLATENPESTEEEARRVLRRVLYWTGGHPYLTQRLCRAIAEAQTAAISSELSPSSSVLSVISVAKVPSQLVGRLCADLFLSPRAREREDNLLFVRDRLLRNEADRADLLDLYARIWRGRPVADDETDLRVSLLRLSGVTRSVEGKLQVRNRIYERVFDRAWVVQRMPDAELRRQRAAFRRGLARATAVATVIVAVVAGLAVVAAGQARLAREGQRLAREGQRSLRRHLYAAQMNLAQQAWEVGNLGRAMDLLKAQEPVGSEEDVRGFEWRWLRNLCRGDAVATLQGHTGGAYDVAFSSDGHVLASVGEDGAIKLWNPASRELLATLRGHRGPVRGIAFSPDGRFLATRGDDKTVKLWDIGTRREIRTLRHGEEPATAIAFSPDGKTLASSSATAVRLRDVPFGREIGRLIAPLPLGSLAFSPDGKTLVTTADELQVRLWDVAARRQSAQIPTTAWVGPVAFSPSGKTLALGVGDNTIWLWDRVAKRRAMVLEIPRGSAGRLVFTPDGRRLISANEDGTLRLWDLATGHEVRMFRGHLAPATAVAISPDGETVAGSSQDGTVKLWEVAPRREIGVLRGHDGWASGVAISPDGRWVASSGVTAVRVWDVATERERVVFRGHTDAIPGVAFSPDGETVASASQDKTARLWDARSRRPIAVLRGHTDRVWVAAFSPDGKTLATGSDDQTVRLWDLGTHRTVALLRGVSDFHGSIDFSPDGRVLATAMHDHTIRLWDVASRRPIGTLSGHRSLIEGVRFSPDGRLLAAGGGDATIKLWDIATRREVATLRGHSNGVWCTAFSPDAKTLASSSGDATVKLWNLTTKEEVATLRGHKAMVETVAFSRDGTLLVSASGDATVRLWRAPFVTAGQ